MGRKLGVSRARYNVGKARGNRPGKTGSWRQIDLLLSCVVVNSRFEIAAYVR